MRTHRNQAAGFAVMAGVTLTLTLLPVRPGAAAMPPNHPVLAMDETSASALARQHWQSIAAGDVAEVMAGYGPQPVLHWDGGAFDGDHAGAAAIQTVWSQFTRARSPLQVQVSRLREKRSGRGVDDSRIVTARVVFRNHDWTYPVDYRLVFRGGQIVEETWHIADEDDGPPINLPA